MFNEKIDELYREYCKQDTGFTQRHMKMLINSYYGMNHPSYSSFWEELCVETDSYVDQFLAVGVKCE